LAKNKKILILVTALDIGGMEMALLKTLPKLKKHVDCRVCCIKGRWPIGTMLEEQGVPVYYLDLKKIYNIGFIIRFRKLINDFKPEVLSTYLIHPNLFGRIFGRIFGIKKIICNERGALLQWEFLRKYDRLTKKFVSHYTVQTETARKETAKILGLSEKKFTVIPNIIDIKTFDFSLDKENKKKKLKINPNNLNITCLARLRKGKGHEYLLEAFENIYKDKKNINLLLVGDGEEEERLKSLIKKYKSKKNIYFLGIRKDVAQILNISDIFTLPTLSEGMSNAILEAMASGLPIVTTDIDVNKELIKHNENGLLVPVEDSLSLESAIRKLIKDKVLCKRLGNNAKETIIKNFDSDIIIKKIVKLYNSI